MKKICLTTAIAVFLLFCSNGIQAQTTQTTLNQIELMKQSVGTWQKDVDIFVSEYEELYELRGSCTDL